MHFVFGLFKLILGIVLFAMYVTLLGVAVLYGFLYVVTHLPV